MNYIELSRALRSPEGFEKLSGLYGRKEGVLVQQIARYTALVKLHEDLFRAGEIRVISSPGRSEIIGNHTDHNNGRVLAAAINLDTLAVVSQAADNKVRVVSEGYESLVIDLSDITPRPQEQGSTAALIRGVAQGMEQLGYKVGGFSAAVTSDVLGGSGLSSSAAFEVMVCCILDTLYNGGEMDPEQRAQIARYAENVHFGKPSGLMDQMACSLGGMVGIDFKTEQPRIDILDVNFTDMGYAMVVVATGGSHDDLIPQYAAIREEMGQVAAFFGEEMLRKVRPEQFYQNIRQLRNALSERAILRAMHYFQENDRVHKGIEALKADDVEAFIAQVKASGRSSRDNLQNIWALPTEQPLSLALSLAEHLLGDAGACRVHGGGFAGTTLNFVPLQMLDEFIQGMAAVFGDRACSVLDVRPLGALSVF